MGNAMFSVRAFGLGAPLFVRSYLQKLVEVLGKIISMNLL
jgi:hypothetical protein